jgi:hypothetical protein
MIPRLSPLLGAYGWTTGFRFFDFGHGVILPQALPKRKCRDDQQKMAVDFNRFYV